MQSSILVFSLYSGTRPGSEGSLFPIAALLLSSMSASFALPRLLSMLLAKFVLVQLLAPVASWFLKFQVQSLRLAVSHCKFCLKVPLVALEVSAIHVFVEFQPRSIEIWLGASCSLSYLAYMLVLWRLQVLLYIFQYQGLSHYVFVSSIILRWLFQSFMLDVWIPGFSCLFVWYFKLEGALVECWPMILFAELLRFIDWEFAFLILSLIMILRFYTLL